MRPTFDVGERIVREAGFCVYIDTIDDQDILKTVKFTGLPENQMLDLCETLHFLVTKRPLHDMISASVVLCAASRTYDDLSIDLVWPTYTDETGCFRCNDVQSWVVTMVDAQGLEYIVNVSYGPDKKGKLNEQNN